MPLWHLSRNNILVVFHCICPCSLCCQHILDGGGGKRSRSDNNKSPCGCRRCQCNHSTRRADRQSTGKRSGSRNTQVKREFPGRKQAFRLRSDYTAERHRRCNESCGSITGGGKCDQYKRIPVCSLFGRNGERNGAAGPGEKPEGDRD